MDTRKCKDCQQFFSLDNFYVLNKEKNYYSAYCKGCDKERSKNRQRKKEVKPYHAKWQKQNPERILMYSAKQRAKKNNLPFNLSIEDIIIPEKCPLLGIDLILDNDRTQPDSPSLDRLIPDLGYVKGNVLVVSHRANTIKNNATPDELLLLTDNLMKILEKKVTTP